MTQSDSDPVTPTPADAVTPIPANAAAPTPANAATPAPADAAAAAPADAAAPVPADAVAGASAQAGVPTWEVWIASIIGSTFVAIADLLINGQNAVTPRIGTIAAGVLGDFADSVSIDTLSFLVMIALGIGLCFVRRPRTRPGAFAQGSSVIAVLAGMNVAAPALAAEARAADVMVQVAPGTEVSTCQPRSYGPFGLGTLLNGDAKGCWTTEAITEAKELPCTETVVIGGKEYCAVDAPAGAGQKYWVQNPLK